MKNQWITSVVLLAGVAVDTGCAGEHPLAPPAADGGVVAHRSGRSAFPATLPLPTGFQPEGIAIGRGDDFYVGATLLGAVYRGSLRTGAGAMVVPPAPGLRMIAGLSHDRRTSLLFAAGGPLGNGHVFDPDAGVALATYQFATPCDPPCTLVNDVVVTRRAAYFTDSFRPVLYRVPLGPHGALPDPSDVGPLPLGGDFQMTDVGLPGVGVPINANGIDATRDGRYLIVVNTSLGTLYRVNPHTGHAVLIDLGDATVPYADGILLEGHDLYVVQNLLNQVAVIRLRWDYAAGRLRRVLTSPRLRIPSTIAGFAGSLYAVNARFDVAPPFVPAPDVEFEVVRVAGSPRHPAHHP